MKLQLTLARVFLLPCPERSTTKRRERRRPGTKSLVAHYYCATMARG